MVVHPLDAGGAHRTVMSPFLLEVVALATELELLGRENLGLERVYDFGFDLGLVRASLVLHDLIFQLLWVLHERAYP